MSFRTVNLFTTTVFLDKPLEWMASVLSMDEDYAERAEDIAESILKQTEDFDEQLEKIINYYDEEAGSTFLLGNSSCCGQYITELTQTAEMDNVLSIAYTT